MLHVNPSEPMGSPDRVTFVKDWTPVRIGMAHSPTQRLTDHTHGRDMLRLQRALVEEWQARTRGRA